MANLVDLWNLKTAIINIHLFDKQSKNIYCYLLILLLMTDSTFNAYHDW